MLLAESAVMKPTKSTSPIAQYPRFFLVYDGAYSQEGARMSLTYGVGGATAALTVVGACGLKPDPAMRADS